MSVTEKHRCEKCNKPFCLYIAYKRSLVGKIKDAKIADKTLQAKVYNLNIGQICQRTEQKSEHTKMRI